MTGLDWEKQNRKENTEPSYLADIANHARKRQSNKNSLAKKTARLIQLERKLQDPFNRGIEAGEERERERIIQLLRARVTKHNPVLTMDIDELEALISARTHENQEQK